MRCPYCASLDTQVKDSRPTEDSSAIRRRRVCPDCGGRFTTFERVQLRELTVVKRSGRRVPFDREKLMRSLDIALRKRAVERERVERMVNGIVRQLESQGDSDIRSERIGELVMEGLRGLDGVAYVRFASVYKNFGEARDFGTIVDELAGREDTAAPAPGCGIRNAMSGAPGDAAFMDAALAYGRRFLGRTAPNPAVGCVIVRDGVIVARGATMPGGRPHAETEALRVAGAAARGATLYVTLEPCSHHGGTPPCADAIVAAGIARVVSAQEDPDSRVAGRGHARLREAGIDLVTGVKQAEAARLTRGHILRVTRGRPMVTLKLAQTADGYVAGDRHDRRLMITGLAANNRVLVARGLHDAIMIGVETAIADDPLLTVRLPGFTGNKPLRIVLDTHARLPLRSRLVATARAHSTLVIAGEGAPAAAQEGLTAAGVEVARVGLGGDGHLDLGAALRLLGSRGLTRIFSEGGPRVAAALIAQHLADEVLLFTAPRPLAREGVEALSPVARGILADPARYAPLRTGHAGADRFLHLERVD